MASFTDRLGPAGVRVDLGDPRGADTSESIWLHRSVLVGRPVLTYPHRCPTVDPGAVAWRVACTPPAEVIDFTADEGRPLPEILADLAAEKWADRVSALAVGDWLAVYDNPPPIAALAAVAPRLPALRVIELGDIATDDYHLHFIAQGDVTPLLVAWPELEVLWVRGGADYSSGLKDPATLQPIRHTGLRRLTLETIGLPARVVRAVADSDLPGLTHLELWLGSQDSGGDATMADLAPILDGTRLPAPDLGARSGRARCDVLLRHRTRPVTPGLRLSRRR